MGRVKNMQLIQQLFQPASPYGNQVAYQSLGWDLGKSIPVFLDSLLKGQISDTVWKAHGITKEEIQNRHISAIRSKLEKNTNFTVLKGRAQSSHDLKIARSVKTNLTPLKVKQIKSLINQAEILTEMQIRLYIPSLCLLLNDEQGESLAIN